MAGNPLIAFRSAGAVTPPQALSADPRANLEFPASRVTGYLRDLTPSCPETLRALEILRGKKQLTVSDIKELLELPVPIPLMEHQETDFPLVTAVRDPHSRSKETALVHALERGELSYEKGPIIQPWRLVELPETFTLAGFVQHLHHLRIICLAVIYPERSDSTVDYEWHLYLKN